MGSEQSERLPTAARRALAGSLTAAAAWAGALAASHMMTVTRWGPICGASTGDLTHCWACHAAAPLAGAALLAWWMAYADKVRAHACP